MTDYRTILERDLERVARPAGFTFDDVSRRRDRKRRNQRITAGVVGIVVFVAAVWTVTSVKSLDRSDTSVGPAGSGATGPTETGPAETGVGNREMDYLLDLETGETTQLPGHIRWDGQNGYAVSPDGSEVAYFVGGPKQTTLVGSTTSVREGGSKALFVAHIDGTHVRQIADDAYVEGGGLSSDMGPGWSPDGTKIAYTGLPSGEGDTNIFVVDLASGVSTQVTFETVHVSGTEFSPDGSSIVYTADLPGGSEVRIAPATGGEGSTLVGGHGSSASGAAFSPDGSLLSYSCNDPADRPFSGDLCLANADGSDPRVIVRSESPDGMGGIVTANWSPDGSRLAFWTFDGIEGVWILDMATNQTTCVAGCKHVGYESWPLQAWPRWLDDHTLFVEAYHGPH